MKLSEIQDQAYWTAENNGFHEDFKNSNWLSERRVFILLVLEKLYLIASEAGEARDHLRHGGSAFGDEFLEELADIVIRTADLAGILSLNLEEAVKKKLEKNEDRPWKHNKSF